jgi:hypothetical protein
MCSQAVSLMAAELERQGIATVAIVLLREVAEKIRPPRALFVPFRHGFPLDTPGDPERQRAVLEAMLRMLEDPGLTAPALADFPRR